MSAYNIERSLEARVRLEGILEEFYNSTVKLAVYNGTGKRLTLHCLKCDKEFHTYASRLAQCTHCSNPKKLCIDSIQPRTDEVFGVGRYTVDVSKFTEYSAKLPVLCHQCNEWLEKKPADLLTRKRGCPKCQSRAETNIANRAKELQERINAIHGDRFTLDATQYKGWKVKQPIACNHCGATAPGRPGSVLEGNGIQCECESAESLGEKAAREFFEEHEIAFEKQWWTPECRHIKPLKFDFLLGTTFIEIDGEQHRKPIAWWGGEEGLKQTQLRDAIKNRWAEENGYTMIRIPYTKTTSIPKILKGIMNVRIDW